VSDPKKDPSPEPPAPVDVRDGIPDRSERRGRWPILVLLGVFLAWLGFLIYCAVGGSP
jgi:hypothetical protein